MELLQNFYETTLDALKDAKNDRLWFKTNTKLGKLYFDRNDFGKLQKILKQLHQSCQVSYFVNNFIFASCSDLKWVSNSLEQKIRHNNTSTTLFVFAKLYWRT